MNYFYLSTDPHECAVMHNDKHVVKMDTEYPQLLSTAHRIIDGVEYLDRTKNGARIKRWRHPDDELENTLYKACHVNHPTAIWVRESKANYENLYNVWVELLREYTYRYGRLHGAGVKLSSVLAQAPRNIPDGPFTEPPPAMKAFPQCIVEGDSIASYRNYYREAKARMAKWTKRPVPKWYYDVEHKII
jgi:hypothetical protein